MTTETQMKARSKFKSVLLISGMVAACSRWDVACAQSNVTFYGLLDTGINWTNSVQRAAPGAPNGRSGASQLAQVDEVMQGGRWGMKGSEDLGGGYRSIFQIEGGFDLGTGVLYQGGTEFGRQAFVGISAPWGTVTIGRQYDLFTSSIGVMQSATTTGAFGCRPGDIDNMCNNYRINNAIKYQSPSWGGLAFGALYGFGGVAGHVSENSTISFGVTYNGPALSAAAGYVRIDNPNQAFWGNQPSGSPTRGNQGAVTGVTFNPVLAGFVSATHYQVAGGAVQYVAGKFLAGLNYSNISFQNLGHPGSGDLALTNPLGYHGTATFNSYSVFGRYYLMPSLVAAASYTLLDGGRVSGRHGARYNDFAAALDYFLSKRTDVYFAADYQLASGTDSTGLAASPETYTSIPGYSARQVILRLGMRHTF